MTAAGTATPIEEVLATLFIPSLVLFDWGTNTPRRKQALRAQFDQSLLWLLDLLVDERIVTSFSDISGTTGYEISHESIFEAWPVLEKVVQQTAPIMEVANALIADATDWQASGYASGRLVYSPEKVLELAKLFDIHKRLLGNQSKICALLLWECWRRNGSTSRGMKMIALSCWVLLFFASLAMR
jgi:hypothetical protein